MLYTVDLRKDAGTARPQPGESINQQVRAPFLQVYVSPDDQEQASVNAPRGRYRSLRLPWVPSLHTAREGDLVLTGLLRALVLKGRGAGRTARRPA